MTSESALLARILLALGRDPRCLIWRMNTGALPDQHGRMVRFGVPGCADILGILRPSGRFLAIEAKAPGGKQSAQQKLFQTAVMNAGGVYLLVYSVEDALAGISNATAASSATPHRFPPHRGDGTALYL